MFHIVYSPKIGTVGTNETNIWHWAQVTKVLPIVARPWILTLWSSWRTV